MIFFFLAAAIASGLLYLLDRHFAISHDPREPPLIPSKVPVLGHVFGILWHGSRYYGRVAKRYPNLPIYTLGVMGSRIYIVTAPELVPLVDRRPNIFSFAPMVIHFAKRLLVSSQESLDKLADYIPEKHGEAGLTPETLKAQHESLAPGQNLELITRGMLQGTMKFLDSAVSLHDAKEVELCDFFRKFITIASTDAVYGAEHNPFQDYTVIEKLWDVYHNFALLGLNVMPDLTAPRGTRARRSVFEAMHKFYAADGHKSESASRIVKARFEVNQKYDIPMTDIEHFDLSISFGLLANAAPTSFWLIYYMYSNPALLSEVRENISSILGLQESTNETHVEKPVLVNIPDVAARYPLLGSFVNEVLRVQSVNASARVVREDTTLDGKYLLKSNSFIFIPSEELHKNTKAWGPTADEFDPRRFLPQNRHAEAKGNRIPVSANRSWGGGVNLCPGRHFAMNELLTILVVMVLRYDVKPMSGSWGMPKTKVHVMASIMEPKKDVRVRIKDRRSQGGIQYEFVWQQQKESSTE